MDPVSAQAAKPVNAVQALLVRPGTAPSLLALVGQDVEVLFQALAPGGVKLQFPSGQSVTAQGELPYPEGTLLRVRIQPPVAGESGLRLQLQEARPPAPPSLLAPLTQSEATTLAARLARDPPLPELAPLLRLLAVLVDGQPEVRNLPSTDQLQAALRTLPGPLLSSLGQVLGSGAPASSQELATTLQLFLQEALPADVRLPEADGDQGLEALVRQGVLRFQTLIAQHPDLPEGTKDSLTTWIRTLLQKAAEESPLVARTPAAPSEVRGSKGTAQDSLIPPKLLTMLQSHPGAKAELPESWESWIRGTITTLSDPVVSPREATFHALQAKEGTAFLEFPLPWAQASPLQFWVESDAPEAHGGGGEVTKRVLLGLKFSRLGETRLGLAQGSFGLQIRVWTEHPETLEVQRQYMEEELKGLGKAVDLKIYTLTYGPEGNIPSLRSLVVGPSLQALG